MIDEFGVEVQEIHETDSEIKPFIALGGSHWDL